MNIEEFRQHCLAKKGTTESFPFGESALVFKVMGKMFALAALDEQPPTANLKCDPEKAIGLRERFPDAISPGFHMNKKHWNTVELEKNVPQGLLLELIDQSYELVVNGLTKKEKQMLQKI